MKNSVRVAAVTVTTLLFTSFSGIGAVHADHTIYQLQDPDHPAYLPSGSDATIEGVIVTGVVNGEEYFVEEPGGGPWSGVHVFDPAGKAPDDLALGDELTISGEIDEYSGLTEIGFLAGVERTGQGLVVPDAEVVASCDIGTGGFLAEAYEGVLVRVEKVVVTDPDLGFGEFEVDGCLVVDDLLYAYTATLGETICSFTGVLSYSFGHHKLEPRGPEDIVTDCPAEWTLELDATYDAGALDLDFLIGAPEPALWATFLIVTQPSVSVLPLWSLPLPATDPPIDWQFFYPAFPGLGVVGFWTALFTPEGLQASVLEWVFAG